MGDFVTFDSFIDRSMIYPGRVVHGDLRPMHCVLAHVKSFPYKTVFFQFWQRDDERGLLECSRSAYAFASFNRLLDIYRTRCIKYQYCKRSIGPVATAFYKEHVVILDLKAHKGSNPLIDAALECDLSTCMMLPIFDPSSKSIIGVVECTVKNPTLLLPIFLELKCALERNNLSLRMPKPVFDWRSSISKEIVEGLKMVCESHALTFAQAWAFNYDDDDDQVVLRFCGGYSIYSDDGFYNWNDAIRLKKGEGLVGRALLTRQPHLYRNIHKITDNDAALVLHCTNTKSTCLVMCASNTLLRKQSFVFQFVWPCTRDALVLFDTLLFTLRKYLPSFEFAFTEQLIDDAYGQINSSSEAPKALNETRTSADANDDDDDDDDDVAIFATYRNQASLFYLPSASAFEIVMEKLKMEFELNPASTYKVEYEASPRIWSGLECLESCWRVANRGVVKLRVRAEGAQVGWKWKRSC
ncbi:hypothetical protein QVD17_29318 [Tagetes erecta]|uniref:NLP1-9 GAF domain-containing protein n=1 Tax=Tagetes erecta TaxID=13708 RepID=A0AAD8KGA9_TARER|nr:hypothetical protein QVD17_29318 [Tagetes erecta]